MSIAPKPSSETSASIARATLSANSRTEWRPAGGDIPGCDTALLAAVRIRAQHRLDDVVDIDEVEHLCARRDGHALAFGEAADERRQKPMRRFTRAIDLEETQAGESRRHRYCAIALAIKPPAAFDEP